MDAPFQFVALPRERFAHLFHLGDAELRAARAVRVVADEKPGYPCRISLVDAEPGESVLLLPFTHHDVSTPYRASGPIYVRVGAATASPAVNEIPLMFHHRLLSIRAYDPAAMLVGATVLKGSDLAAGIGAYFARDDVSYLHVHNAGPGCYNCRVVRVA